MNQMTRTIFIITIAILIIGVISLKIKNAELQSMQTNIDSQNQ